MAKGIPKHPATQERTTGVGSSSFFTLHNVFWVLLLKCPSNSAHPFSPLVLTMTYNQTLIANPLLLPLLPLSPTQACFQKNKSKNFIPQEKQLRLAPTLIGPNPLDHTDTLGSL